MKHAVKVIETVTFVVDSIGDQTKDDQLNEALVNLVRGHQKRNIGLTEFQNLGIVLIDFICDLNNRRCQADGRQANPNCRLMSSSDMAPATRPFHSSTSSSQDPGTMTSALDRIRASLSPSSSSEDDSVLSRTLASELLDEPMIAGPITDDHQADKYAQDQNANTCDSHGRRLVHDSQPHSLKLDTSQLVIAWKKLYKIILDLVRSEEARAGE